MKKILVGVLAFAPFLVFAAENIGDLTSAIKAIGNIINQVVPLIFAVATLYMLWNILKFIEAGTADVKAKEGARDQILFSVVLLFVMMSIWGLVGVVSGTIQFDQKDAPKTDFIKPF
ncbi:MAG: hypothetical protein WCO84_02220 [bacterium]